MPLYEYHCGHCDHDVEVLMRSSETPTCPECGSSELDKLLSVPAAPLRAAGSLPVYSPSETAAGCGRPQCGSGRCMLSE